jgi:hypothetical protein
MLPKKLIAVSAVSLAAGCAFTQREPMLGGPGESSLTTTTVCGRFSCEQASVVRTTKLLAVGDLVESNVPWSMAPYVGWTVSRIGEDGVELSPGGDSAERVVLPYGRQESVEPSPRYGVDVFISSLVFEKGSAPGTVLMTITER